MDASFTEQFFTTADGPRVHYRDYPAAGPARGVPVLCLHGLTRNERDFEDLSPMIAGLGRRVIVPSQRGRGLSDPDPKLKRYNPGTYTSDMWALLDSLGVDRAVFVGTSMGGLMTMLAAIQAPQRLAGAVLNDIGPELDPAGIARIRSYAGVAKSAASWPEAAAIAREINGAAFTTQTSEAFWDAFARRTFREEPPGRLVLDYDPGIAEGVKPPPDGAEADLWPLFDALSPIPTLVIRGAISDLLMVSTLDEMKRRKPDLHLAQVPDVGHAPFMTEPAAWAALEGFLATTP